MAAEGRTLFLIASQCLPAQWKIGTSTPPLTFKRVCEAAGIGHDWQPRETRHTFVSIASSNGVAIEDIADAAGHVNSNVTRAVYRHLIADTVTKAPAAMDRALAGGRIA